MNNDASVALWVAVISLVTSVVTTLINVGYQLYVRNQERKERVQNAKIKPIIDLFHGYLNKIGKIAMYSHRDYLAEYGEYYPAILLHIPQKDWDTFQTINELIEKEEFKQITKEQTDKLISIINSEIEKLYKDKLLK